MTYDDFYNKVTAFSEAFQHRNLKNYLSALLKLVIENEKTPFSAEFCLELLKKSFTAEALPFSEEWLSVKNLPEGSTMERKFTNPELFTNNSVEMISNANGFSFTKEVLLFQIADLHRMQGKEWDNPQENLGIISPTSTNWYNLELFSFLECGAGGMCDFYDDEKTIPNDWQFLGELLEMGMFYE